MHRYKGRRGAPGEDYGNLPGESRGYHSREGRAHRKGQKDDSRGSGSGRHSGHGRGHGNGYEALAEPEGTQLLFIGSRSCFRHKGTQKMQLLQEGRLSFLCLDDIDWITGSYLELIEQAAEEIIRELHPTHLVLFGGCQIELLSTDYQAITERLSEELETDVHFHRGCHLIGYGEELEQKDREREAKKGKGLQTGSNHERKDE